MRNSLVDVLSNKGVLLLFAGTAVGAFAGGVYMANKKAAEGKDFFFNLGKK